MDGVPAVACFGDRCLPARLVFEATSGPGTVIQLEVNVADLVADPPDLLGPLKVWFVRPGSQPEERQLRFGGYATTLEPVSETTWRLEAHNMADWADVQSGGFTTKNTQPAEVLYAMARDLGMAPEKIQIFGWQPPRERLLVAMPVHGVTPKGELAAGSDGLAMSSAPEVAERFAELKSDELQALFSESGMWAVTWVEAETLWDAERGAVRAFERMLGRLILAARYSFAMTPEGAPRPFRRERQLEQVRLGRVSAIEGAQSKRMWLRGTAPIRPPKPVDAGSIEGFERLLGAAEERLDEAIVAWRRALAEPDPSAAAVALAEALEFYAAGVKPASLFDEEHLRKIKKAAREAAGPLDEERLQRIDDRIGQLKEPPAGARLREAITADGVDVSPSEFELLARIREIRRKVVHGVERVAPTDEELRLMMALVNRLLAFRLRSLRGPSPDR